MKNATTRAQLLATSMITGVAFAALTTTAFAQAAVGAATPVPDTKSDSSSASSGGSTVQELVVTGSRIPTKNLTSVSPITSVTDQEIKAQGSVNVEDFINNLPQAFADFGNYESNGSTGTSTVNLRGLGSVRTLVLIDGKRLQPGDPTDPVADLNFIPPSLIERVEVLTGGASAVYGSDAVAGVVNFIMKKNFTGLQFDGEFTEAEHDNNDQQVRKANKFGSTSFGFPLLNLPSGSAWSGQRYTATLIGGANTPDDKGNVEFYLGYSSVQAVLEGKFDYSTCSLSTNNTNSAQQYCGGSSTNATGRLTPESGPNAGASFNILGTPVGGTIPAFSRSEDYNFAPLNYIQRPDTRYTAGEFSNYEINKALDIYTSFMFLDDHSVAQIGPSGSFYGDNVFNIPCNDPLLSAAQVSALCGSEPAAGQIGTAAIGRRNIEGGGRTDDIEHQAYRVVIGAKGDIGSGWTYDVSAQYGRTTKTDIEGGYFLNSKLRNALDVVPNPAVGGVAGVATGAAVCAVALAGTDTACVPYNIFSAGGVTQQALGYVEGAAQYGGSTTEQVVTGTISGDLSQYGFKSPFATDGIGVSIGAEYRREFLQTNYDSVVQSGDLAGFGGSVKDTEGTQSDKDIFGELRVPLVQDVPFVKNLTFEGGYRFSNYTSGGDNNTYKLGLDWQIIPDFRLRASYERAVRAPNVAELFTPATPGLVAASDPCAGSTPSLSAAQCYNTFTRSAPGISEATFASTIYGTIPQCVSAQCGSFGGGNPNLTPESADTKSVGFVFTPSFFRGFSLTLDYFDITVNKAIIALPAATLLNNCAVLDNAFDCAAITRNPQLGYAVYGGNGLGFVDQQLINGSALKTNGIDIDANYRFRLEDFNLPAYGAISLNMSATYVSRLVTVLPDGTGYDCAGLYGVTCGTPTPKFRSQTRLTWTTPWNLGLSVNWRHLSPTNLDFNTNQSDLQNGFKDTLPTDAHIPAFNYIDLSFTYRLKDRYTFRGGVNNVFDLTPPLLDSNSFGISAPPFGNANTYPQVFDPLGRVFFLGVTADF